MTPQEMQALANGLSDEDSIRLVVCLLDGIEYESVRESVAKQKDELYEVLWSIRNGTL